MSPRLLQVLLSIAGLMAVAFSVVWFRCGLAGCPDVGRLTSYQPGRAPVLLDRNGQAFADLAPVAGEVVPLRSLPKHVPEAFLAVEDRRFYGHRGVDWRRAAGALVQNVRSGGVQEGFSTLTMQLARNVFPDRLPGRERTLTRKLLEIRVAYDLERRFRKNEILELYLNHIYFGNGARGVEAAARHYFGKPARSLSVGQAALLAALPRGPSLYDPRRHPKEARRRRDLVLTLMEDQHRISGGEASAARAEPLGVSRKAPPPRDRATVAPYYVEEVRREVEDLLGDGLYDETLRIHTTLDLTAQQAAEEALRRQLAAVDAGALGPFRGPRYAPGAPPSEDGTPYLQGAVLAVETRTGDVLAWVGGRDFQDSRFDRVRFAKRQVGSAFKPFVYAAALASGHTLTERVQDEPLRVSLGGARFWEPRNFDGMFEGPITIREALVRSKNVPTLRLADSIGYDAVAGLTRRMGLEEPLPNNPSMPLGTVSTSPLALVSAYTGFAGQGERVPPRLLVRIEKPNGDVLWAAETPQHEAALDPGTAFLVTDVLREAVSRGTATPVRSAGFAGPAAGKTGTTNDGTDAWFVGYTPDVVAAVWIGFDEPRPILPRATGGHLAAPVWGQMMARLYRSRPMPGPWSPPAEVVQASVDPDSGLVLAPGCRPFAGPAYREFFLRGSMPAAVCPSQGPPPEFLAETPPANLDDEATDLPMDLPPELQEPRAGRQGEEKGTAPEAAPASPAAVRRPPPTESTPEEPRSPEPRSAEPSPAEPRPSPSPTPGETGSQQPGHPGAPS